MSGREVVVAVTGGVAAYKSAILVSRLVQSGFGVSAVMTDSAERFLGSATLAALTGRPVARSSFDEQRFPLGAHIALAERSDLFCVAPATANFLAKAAHGVADDLVSTLYLAFDGPVVVAPAMNHAMWQKPAVQRNVRQLREDGVQVLGPSTGWLSCRQPGTGRMVEPEEILEAIRGKIGNLSPPGD